MKDHRPKPQHRTTVDLKAHLNVLCAVLIFASSELWATTVVETAIPITSETQTLLIENISDSEQTLWMSKPLKANQALDETSYSIPAKSKLKIPLQSFQDEPWLRVQAMGPELQLKTAVSTGPFTDLPWGTSNALSLNKGLKHSVIWLSNLTGQEQSFRIEGKDNGALYLSDQLLPFQTKKLTWRGSANSLLIHADLRIAALIEDSISKDSQIFLPVVSDFKQNIPRPTEPQSARFVMANSANNQSFVIELSDPELIKASRLQISEPKTRQHRMLVARVEKDSGLFNFDSRGVTQAPWSWHVSEVYRFADFGSIDCDGSPQMMEQTLEWWLAAHNGLICFWDYKIKSEMP